MGLFVDIPVILCTWPIKDCADPGFLDPNEKFGFRVTKVIHNCLLADRYPIKERALRSDLEHGWPQEVREQVLERWKSYGYR
jgi:hypothetical protein